MQAVANVEGGGPQGHSPHDHHGQGEWTPRARRLALSATIVVLLMMLGRLWWLPAHASLNVNEGWNAGHVARAFGAGLLYPSPDALFANNYPPLSFFVVGLVEPIVGDAIIAGRIVSLLSQIAVGLAIYVIAGRLVRDRLFAAAAAGLFAALSVTILRKYLAMNDPQWLGQAFMAWALVLLVPRRVGARLGAGTVIAAAALVVAGGLVKHNLVAIPIAVTLWLWFTDRRPLWIWVSSGALMAVIALAGLYAIWGADVFAQVLGPARSYSLRRMLVHGVPLLLFILPGLLAARPLLAAWRSDTRLLLPLLFLGSAVPTAFLQRSGAGVDINAIFETMIAFSIVVPVGCSLRMERPWRWYALAFVPPIAFLPVAAVADIRELAGRGEAERHWRPFIEQIARADGPVACDDQSICHWAGRQSALDFFALKQRLVKGEQPALTEALARKEIAMIAMRSSNPGWHENRLIPAIRRHYRTVYEADGTELLVPR